MNRSTGPAAALLAAALLAGACSSGASERHRVLIGSVAKDQAELAAREQESGRRLSSLRIFRRWGEDLVDPYVRSAADRHVLFLSVKARLADGRSLSWADLAASRPGSALDREVRRQAGQLKQLDGVVYFTFNHEPDNKASSGMGTPEEYAAAWRRVVSVFRDEGADNVRFVWTLTDQTFAQKQPERYYPGDAYVDHIGVDAYNWHQCRGRSEGWRSLAELIEPHRQFGLRHPGKGLMILEWGSVEDADRPNRKARWLDEAARLFTKPEYRGYKALLHWDDRYARGETPAECNWDYRTSPAATAAWRRMVAAPTFSAAEPCDIGDCPEPGLPPALLVLAAGGTLLVGGGATALVVARRRRGLRATPDGPRPGG
ncbi:glycoside hydrolase family 26 protein [Actinomadura sp. 9N407]|uniref:glycoside hydrolase family 26 protein n=1 Tax=Actinomadura sp. 9N407 TaxID=3375154 RepID=UPI00379A480C